VDGSLGVRGALQCGSLGSPGREVTTSAWQEGYADLPVEKYAGHMQEP
jgi:hypothetical protein